MPDVVKDFLGSGWKFPPRLDSRGRVELVHQERDIEEAIKMILLTRKGERPMRPGFGSDLHTLLYQPNDASTCGLARRFVHEALAMWEPRIVVMEVTAEPERDPHFNNGTERLMIGVRYRPLATNSERNLVFPFYTIPGGE